MSDASYPRWARRTAGWMLATAWAAALVATHVPLSGVGPMRTSDKVLHVIGYMGLGGLFWLTRRLHGRSIARRGLVVLPVLMLYGALDELTQPRFGRSADIIDWLADVTGIAMAVIVCELATAAARMTSPK